jgi:hypothetical protein
MAESEELAPPADGSDPRRQTILDLLRAGNTRKTAWEVAGVAKETFQRWIDESPTFRAAVTAAEAQAEADYAAAIRAAALGGQLRKRKILQYPDGRVAMEEERTAPDWRAAAHWLDRRKQTWRVTKPVDLRKLSDDQLIRLLEEDAATACDGAEAEAGGES